MSVFLVLLIGLASSTFAAVEKKNQAAKLASSPRQRSKPRFRGVQPYLPSLFSNSGRSKPQRRKKATDWGQGEKINTVKSEREWGAMDYVKAVASLNPEVKDAFREHVAFGDHLKEATSEVPRTASLGTAAYARGGVKNTQNIVRVRNILVETVYST
eukprot:CAMPEP_0196584094 /NCGR_PEP_ID=MMETSP1081-20130531/45779_1 /TAXON_ID=36882 /ORGANISM="Pyramimonas amylifera, Strain CCMP720" /LENGTH=156 /DNA_ID=CAMNT_0041905185 /DNA_START=205 /DNA_END=675 /DNA_ORIENTATION=-